MSPLGANPRSDRMLFAGAALVMVAIIAIIGWTLWQRAFQPAQRAVVAEAMPPPGEESKDAVSPLPPDPGDFIGPTSDFVGPPSPKQVVRPKTAQKSVSQPTTPSAAAPPVVSTPATARQNGDVTASLTGSSKPSARAPVAGLTYSKDDVDVTPPAVASPQLLAMLSEESPGVRTEVMTISVIVNEHGTVDSVRAINIPVSLSESVKLTAALSAVKTWQFRPATKNGTPVKYRQIVPLRIAVP